MSLGMVGQSKSTLRLQACFALTFLLAVVFQRPILPVISWQAALLHKKSDRKDLACGY